MIEEAILCSGDVEMSLDTQDGWCSGLDDNFCILKGCDKSSTVISEMVALWLRELAAPAEHQISNIHNNP